MVPITTPLLPYIRGVFLLCRTRASPSSCIPFACDVRVHARIGGWVFCCSPCIAARTAPSRSSADRSGSCAPWVSAAAADTACPSRRSRFTVRQSRRYGMAKIPTKREGLGWFRLEFNPKTRKIMVKEASFGYNLSHLREDFYLSRGVQAL